MIIGSVEFSCLSPQKIKDISVCEVVTAELYQEGRPKTGGLRDPRFGVSSRRGICTACQRTWTQCSGHFGHFQLPIPVYHIGWVTEVLFWLRKTCAQCGHVSAKKLGKKCPKCSGMQPKISKLNSITLKITDKKGQR